MVVRVIHTVDQTSDMLRSLIARTQIDFHYINPSVHDFRDLILDRCNGADRVLDVGKSMRERFGSIGAKKIETLDINDFGDYPDLVADLCAELPDDFEQRYDVVIALAVLEHVYDPFAAVRNVRSMLRPGGTFFGYVPWIYAYHAPEDLKFQDYYRFSRDGLSYLFKDFSSLKLCPIRGRYPTVLNLLPRWKRRVEKWVSPTLYPLLNRLSSNHGNTLQTSGYCIVAEV